MIKLPDDSASSNIGQIPTDGATRVDTSPFLLRRPPAKSNVSPTASTASSASGCIALSRCTSMLPFAGTRPETYETMTVLVNNQEISSKGKAVPRSLGWRMAIHDASQLEREELAYQLLAMLPRSQLAAVQRRIMPLLQFDLVGSLPPELALQIFILLPAAALLNCTLVCKRWNLLANDQALWRNLCHTRGWEWRSQPLNPPPRQSDSTDSVAASSATREDRDEDEGMGDEEEDEDEGGVVDAEVSHVPNGHVNPDNEPISMNLSLQDHDFQNLIGQFTSLSSPTTLMPISRSSSATTTMIRTFSQHQATAGSSQTGLARAVDYKLLHQTQILLRSRVRHGTYRLRTLPGAEGGGHTAAVYCLALWSYQSAYGPIQVLFTGSKDRTVREWDLATNRVRRRAMGMHASSVLSLCVTAKPTRIPDDGNAGSVDHAKESYRNSEAGILVSGGSDCRVVVWDLAKFKLIKILKDHQDSVLCVRVDSKRLVSCSKDRTIRTYSWPYLKPGLVLRGHRAAVNAVSIAGDVIVSGSGDRSVRIWDACTGAIINHLDDHHTRAISSVELSPPFILSGSSDRHVRMCDMRSKRGWSTCPDFDNPTAGHPSVAQEGSDNEARNAIFLHSSLSQSSQQIRQEPHIYGDTGNICNACGTRVASTGGVRGPERHSHPVRSVAMGDEFAVSGSYDCTVKVWDRTTGALVADLTSGHTGRIFCVAQDSTKIVSCGEDQRICIWDFSHGIDTSFIKL